MKLRKYCVTVNDNWTPATEFWTLVGAKKFYSKRSSCANVYKWDSGVWRWVCGAKDLDSFSKNSRSGLRTTIKD